MNITQLLDPAAQILAGAACIVIVVRCEVVINRMNRRTPLIVRLAFWLLLIGAAGAGAQITLAGAVPPWPAVFGVWGAALLLFCERRLRYLVHRPKGRAEA